MAWFRYAAVALVLVIGCTGCTRHPMPVNQPTGSINSTTAVTSSLPTMSSAAAPARPTVSSTHAPAPQVPPVSTQARAAGLVDIRTVVPDAIVDLRYATSNNFVGVPLYPADARCLVHQSMVAGLRTAAAVLRRQGDLLVFWDCYRPHAVQVRMFQIVPNPNWVARPGPDARSHEAARSVDVTLAYASDAVSCPADQRDHGHCLLDMGTGFDDFTARAHAYATDGVSTRAQANRALLRRAMNAGGIVVYAGEWWHFDGPGALVGRPFLNVLLD